MTVGETFDPPLFFDLSGPSLKSWLFNLSLSFLFVRSDLLCGRIGPLVKSLFNDFFLFLQRRPLGVDVVIFSLIWGFGSIVSLLWVPFEFGCHRCLLHSVQALLSLTCNALSRIPSLFWMKVRRGYNACVEIVGKRGLCTRNKWEYRYVIVSHFTKWGIGSIEKRVLREE